MIEAISAPSHMERGLIIAPAGCGKTQTIIELLSDHSEHKPILVLTHTNSGVAAIKSRLEKFDVQPSRFRLSTLDGWALRLVTTFPLRSGYSPTVPAVINYPEVREAAIRLIAGNHISDCLLASYAKIIVDEYQDCSARQHRLICHAAQLLPTYVLGDPLQAIFGFDQADPLASWDNDVCSFFPLSKELEEPWRWINAGNEPLGRWLLGVRHCLQSRTPIDLRSAPAGVQWIKLEGTADDHMKQVRAAGWTIKTDEQVLIIGNSRNPANRHLIASQVYGTTVVEPVDLRDMVNFANGLDLVNDNLLEKALVFAETMMTNVGRSDLLSRITILLNGKARKEASKIESAAIHLFQNRTYQSVRNLLTEIGQDRDTRIYRQEMFRCVTQALNICCDSSNLTLHEASIQIREQNRVLGRKTRKRSIGSTLLLKGLEADAVIILNADQLDRQNLYVAMTRGAKTLVICSREPILNPA